MIQIPPAVGSSGQFIESAVVTSSQNRHVMVIGDGVSTAYGPVTSSAGQLVSVSSGTFTLSSAPTVSSTATTITSGTVTIAGTVTILSASSGLVQISGIPTVIAASSAGHQIGSLTSGTVTLSSAPLVIVATSGGTIPVTLSTVFSLSSNPTVISASSGLVQISGNVTVVGASSGAFFPVIVATSGGTFTVGTTGTLIIVSASSGLIQLSSQITVATTGTLVVVSASSGVVQIITSTGTGGGVTSTYKVLTTVHPIKTAAGRLMGFSAYATALTSQGSAPILVFYNLTTANVVIGTSQAFVTPIQVVTTGTATSVVDIAPTPPSWFGPNGLDFNTAISVASAITATGVVHATNVYFSAMYV